MWNRHGAEYRFQTDPTLVSAPRVCAAWHDTRVKTYRLEAGDDHVQKLAHENDPVRAVIELVWNSLDADAHHVTVVLHRNETDVVVGAEVTDDGHGMAPEDIATEFKWVGNSWKRTALRSKGERRLSSIPEKWTSAGPVNLTRQVVC